MDDDDEMLCRQLPMLTTRTGIASVMSVVSARNDTANMRDGTFIPAIEGDGGRLTSLAPARRLMAAEKTKRIVLAAKWRLKMQIGCLE